MLAPIPYQLFCSIEFTTRTTPGVRKAIDSAIHFSGPVSTKPYKYTTRPIDCTWMEFGGPKFGLLSSNLCIVVFIFASLLQLSDSCPRNVAHAERVLVRTRARTDIQNDLQLVMAFPHRSMIGMGLRCARLADEALARAVVQRMPIGAATSLSMAAKRLLSLPMQRSVEARLYSRLTRATRDANALAGLPHSLIAALDRWLLLTLVALIAAMAAMRYRSTG